MATLNLAAAIRDGLRQGALMSRGCMYCLCPKLDALLLTHPPQALEGPPPAQTQIRASLSTSTCSVPPSHELERLKPSHSQSGTHPQQAVAQAVHAPAPEQPGLPWSIPAAATGGGPVAPSADQDQDALHEQVQEVAQAVIHIFLHVGRLGMPPAEAGLLAAQASARNTLSAMHAMLRMGVLHGLHARLWCA